MIARRNFLEFDLGEAKKWDMAGFGISWILLDGDLPQSLDGIADFEGTKSNFWDFAS